MQLVFTLAIFLSAALLFVVEPMFGKMVLPLLGGSPAVWTTCMLFFQGALLAGYLYAHIVPRRLGLRRHAVLHIALLALGVLLLPISISGPAGALRFEHPNLWLLSVLTISLGLPFVLLSSTGPLLQLWFSRTDHPSGHNPYFLYAASNFGSLIALLSYPILIEPSITLKWQMQLWSLSYIALIALVMMSSAYLWASAGSSLSLRESDHPVPRVGRGKMLRWTLLAFVPSSFFLALTTYMTTDVAAVPLLWVIPLVLYLLSFTMVFGRRTIIRHTSLIGWQSVGLIVLVVIGFWGPSGSGPWLLPLHLLVFFVTALVCHGELAATKPTASRLTDFYLCIAVGGVLGGIFNALVAPAVFDSVLEYPLTILIACAVRPGPAARFSRDRARWDVALILAASAVLVWTRLENPDRPATAAVLVSSGLVAVACLRLSRDPARFTLAVGLVVAAAMVTAGTRKGILLKERNFFGVREVREDAQRALRVLMHGTTSHGAQSAEPSRRREPVSYYHRRGPVGDVFQASPPTRGRRVAVIGLGAGGLASYAGVGEEWTFYEIDPDIARVASDTNYFTYLRDTPAAVRVKVGDGRLSLAEAPDNYYDIIVIDAFSSDAIPLHLLTLEALSLYRSRLSARGLLVLHLSNRYLDLEPVLARLIQASGMVGRIRADTQRDRELELTADPSIWAALASESYPLGALQYNKQWRRLRIREGVGLWTDDFSNIFSVFVWSVPRLSKDKPGSKAPLVQSDIPQPRPPS